MRITFDPAKRAATLKHRGIDFMDAALVFAGPHVTAPDHRRDYGERRFISVGHLAQRPVLIAWTPRDNTRRIIPMRYAHAKEAERWRRKVG